MELLTALGNLEFRSELIYVFNGKGIKSCTSLKILQIVIRSDRTIITRLDAFAEKGLNYEEVKWSARNKIS